MNPFEHILLVTNKILPVSFICYLYLKCNKYQLIKFLSILLITPFISSVSKSIFASKFPELGDFPSGHQTFTIMYTSLFLYMSEVKRLQHIFTLSLIGFLSGYSMIQNDYHNKVEVLGGTVLGLSISLISFYFFKKSPFYFTTCSIFSSILLFPFTHIHSPIYTILIALQLSLAFYTILVKRNDDAFE